MKFASVCVAPVALLAALPGAASAQADLAGWDRAPADRLAASYLDRSSLAALQSAADGGDIAAAYLLFALLEKQGSPDAQARLSKLALTNTDAGRFAYALSSYLREAKDLRGRGVEIVGGSSQLSGPQRQSQIDVLVEMAPRFPKAYALLAAIHQDGVWLPANAGKAANYTDLAAKAGVASALAMKAEAASLSGEPAATVAKLAQAAVDAGATGAAGLACAALLREGRNQDAVRSCRAAADSGVAWAQLAAGRLLATGSESERTAASAYLAAAAKAPDPQIAEAATMRHAALLLEQGDAAGAVAALAAQAQANRRAAWLTGRILLDRRSDARGARAVLARALTLPGPEQEVGAIRYDLARAAKADGADWLPELRKAADAGHAQAALALAFELLASAPAEAKAYATAASGDPRYADRAREVLDYLAAARG